MPYDEHEGGSRAEYDNDDAKPIERADVVETEAKEPAGSVDSSSEQEGDATTVDETAFEVNRPLDELTLAEFVAHGVRSPLKAWRQLKFAAKATSAGSATAMARARVVPAISPRAGRAITLESLASGARHAIQLRYARLALYIIAVAAAVIGSMIMRGDHGQLGLIGDSFMLSAPYLWAAFFLWLAAEILGQWENIRDCWWQSDRLSRLRWIARILPAAIWISALFLLATSMSAPQETSISTALTAINRLVGGAIVWILIEFVAWRIRQSATRSGALAAWVRRQPLEQNWIIARETIWRGCWREISGTRVVMALVAVMFSAVIWLNTSGNRIEPPIMLLWLVNAALWAFVFAPLRWNLFDWATRRVDGLRRFGWRKNRPVLIALGLIMLMGASFRLDQLQTVPAEMHSDLVEKIQDAYKIYHLDDYRIFFANIGGREPLHFYLLSILASQPGMSFDHYALKLMSALESIVTLPILFWLGVEVMGERRRKLGLLVGLVLAGLVAASFWHVVLGRQGMRISLATLFTALTLVFYVRALRHNRRSDYVKAGLALGFGLCGYQAVRMLPAALVLGVLLSLVMGKHTWRARVSYLFNLAILAFVSLMVFLPLLHYWAEEPESYLRRTTTRIFGDMPTNEEERLDFITNNGHVLLHNFRNTLLMFSRLGDNTWVSGMSHEPAMDTTSAAFMVLGAAAWLVMMARARDPVIWFVPLSFFVMLLPSTLALSFPGENPSFIRASGAIPASYLVAALPVAVFCRQLRATLGKRYGVAAVVIFASCILLAANHYNRNLYFGEFQDNNVRASHPHSAAGKFLRGFAESDGAYGNAMILNSPHWWDYRAVGIEAGVMFWDSGTGIADLPHFLRRGLARSEPFRLDPERDLLFFYSVDNEAVLPKLRDWFPDGKALRIQTYQPGTYFYTYRAPALGIDKMDDFIDANA